MNNKRKSCLTSPDGIEQNANDNNRSVKIFKNNSKMSITDSDLQKIKYIIDDSLHTELQKATANLASKEDLNALNTEITFLRKQNEDLAQKVHQFEARCVLLEEELEAQSRELKGKNIIFSLPSECTDPEEKVRCITQLLLDKTDIQGIPKPIKISRNNNIIKMKLNTGCNETALKMLKNSARLKNTGVYIQRDLTKHMQLKRRILLQYRKIIKQYKPNALVLIKNNALHIENKIFYLNNNNKLEINGNDGESELQQMFGQLDFRIVINTKQPNTRRRQDESSRSIPPNASPGMPLQQSSSNGSSSSVSRN